MIEYTDWLQQIRMNFIWPLFVIMPAAAMFVRFLASVKNEHFTRTQAMLSISVGFMAVVVSNAIALNWNGSELAWALFTIGLVFLGVILWANFLMACLRAK